MSQYKHELTEIKEKYHQRIGKYARNLVGLS